MPELIAAIDAFVQDRLPSLRRVGGRIRPWSGLDELWVGRVLVSQIAADRV